MRLLLTSAGISNTSIRDTLVDLLGKPIAESNALCIPTAAYASPRGASMAYQLIHGVADTPLCEVGWKSLGVLELTALPSIEKAHWTSAVQQTDALLVGGGDPLYLCYWMRQSGLADLLPSLHETVYVGVSAGSTVLAPHLGKGFVRGMPPTGDKALGVVDFALFPHLDDEDLPRRIHEQRRKVGRQRDGARLRDRRPDRHQSDRWQPRSRLRRTLEAVHSQSRSRLIGLQKTRTSPGPVFRNDA